MTSTSAGQDEAFKAGLLMESAQSHQAMAADAIQRLQSHIRDIDVVVRDEIRRTLLEELRDVSAEAQRATQALRAAGFRAQSRLALIGFAVLIAGTAIACGVLLAAIPSPGDIQALRARRAELEAHLSRLKADGGLVEWRRCGADRRLCFRVEPDSPSYGEHGEFRVAKGY